MTNKNCMTNKTLSKDFNHYLINLTNHSSRPLPLWINMIWYKCSPFWAPHKLALPYLWLVHYQWGWLNVHEK
jgi:hypothetical protein